MLFFRHDGVAVRFARRGSFACVLVGCMVLQQSLVAQTPRDMVQQAVDIEINASRADHTPWLYHQVDKQPGNSVRQWVAETHDGDVKRVLEKNGVAISRDQQQKDIDTFIHDDAGRAKQKKSGEHDGDEAETMVRLLPDAFVWKVASTDGKITTLNFEPDPSYKATSYEARVFAAMAGEMKIDNQQHRIAALKGRLIHDVTFGYGLFGRLKEGGSFEMKRDELAPGKWQITSTHVHIVGKALFFKSIGEEEDDVHTDFQREPEDVTLQQAAASVMSKPETPQQQEAKR
jgi:hypothetical protein